MRQKMQVRERIGSKIHVFFEKRKVHGEPSPPAAPHRIPAAPPPKRASESKINVTCKRGLANVLNNSF